jgi:hypothetical protein
LPSHILSGECRLSEDQLNRRLKESLNLYVNKIPWSKLPSGKPLIIIADAMMQKVDGQTYTIYFILIREKNSNIAVISRPTILKGSEINKGWYRAFANLDKKIFHSVVALVCDGQSGLVYLAKSNGWIIQRCHFHLLAAIQGRRSRSRFSRHRKTGDFLYKTVSGIITGKGNMSSDLAKVQTIAGASNSQILRKVLRGFIKHYSDYQNYYKYPGLNLPRTSNSAESVVGSARALLRKVRGLRTRQSFILWIHAFVKHKKTVVCNGSFSTK